MSALWRGTWATRARIASGLVLFFYVSVHFVNIALVLISPHIADAAQDLVAQVVRSQMGSVLLYGALSVHAALSLGKVALRKSLRLSATDAVQVGFGVTIPLLLASHIVFTRLSFELFETNDTVSYIAALIWNTDDGWLQAGLLLITWVHGCLGLHMWLRMTQIWQRNAGWFFGLATLVPTLALTGFMAEGRRAKALLSTQTDARLDFLDATNWPGPDEFASLIIQSRWAFWGVVATLSAVALLYLLRQLFQPRRSLRISYIDGPTIRVASGPTLLEISQSAGVPHMSLCGGRGRCTTCRVIIDEGAKHLPPPSDAESRALKAVGAVPGARLACQLRPTTACRVHRIFQPDGKRRRAPSSQGKEAQLAILFLDMRGFTSRTTGQLPYDVVFLLNRFFDAIVPPITAAGGTVDKYLGDGLLAVFELPDARASAQASLRAAQGIGAALRAFNDRLATEGAPPVKIGLSLHLGTLVLGEIGAAGAAPRTLIGDTVNAASRLEAETKALGVEALISAQVLEAAGISISDKPLRKLSLRGVASPIRALEIADLTTLPMG